MRISRIGWPGLVAGFALLATLLTPTAGFGGDVRSDTQPAGMNNFTVAVGRVDPGVRTNWQRLATYRFGTDGTVTEQHWHWTQSRRVKRSYTGVQASDCPARDCNIQTANGFQSSSAPKQLTGRYTVTGDVLRVEWTGDQWEEWRVSQPIAGKLAELTFLRSNFGATHGYGFGSRASLSDRATTAELAAIDHTDLIHEFRFWKTDSNGRPYLDSGGGSPFWMTDWERCGAGRCLSGESATPTEYYVAAPNKSTVDRRDTLWHWRRALADGRGEYCYTGNSHVKPMLQIIDSDGNFHGWVGVEASLSQTSSGTNSDDVGVFKIARY
ncbi:hypothetical protein LX16_0455 [Stackebrandtia albiflava]|uniref:Uncharacterized protein n=1 Tax=Stackebrandtia albiflava TaxID=406432 RepID=A0A562VA73_9ACTN|nr:hypothetical protein [Stackebrandtia albiflava]TWJ14765.1 hypothetical protein LX16_0455 [Stackebrandtia albiflava]